jgi:hypothetical protein
MYESKRDEVSGELYSEELHDLYSSPNIKVCYDNQAK